MKKAAILITGFILFLSCAAQGQSRGFSVTGGIGQYQLNELKVYQDELLEKMPVDMMTLSSIPPYTSFRISYCNQNLQGFKYEFVYAYSTTGIHSNYSDFSGYLNLDQTVETFQLGAGAAYRLLYLNGLEILAYGDLRIGYVQDRVEMNVLTAHYYDNRSLILRKVSPFAEAGIELLKHFNSVSLGLQGGYCQDIAGNFRIPETNSNTLLLEPSGPISSRMSGFRGGIKFILWFSSSPGVAFSL